MFGSIEPAIPGDPPLPDPMEVDRWVLETVGSRATICTKLHYCTNDSISYLLIMPPRLQFSCEVSVGVSDLQIVDDLGASIGLDSEDCQLSHWRRQSA